MSEVTATALSSSDDTMQPAFSTCEEDVASTLDWGRVPSRTIASYSLSIRDIEEPTPSPRGLAPEHHRCTRTAQQSARSHSCESIRARSASAPNAASRAAHRFMAVSSGCSSRCTRASAWSSSRRCRAFFCRCRSCAARKAKYARSLVSRAFFFAAFVLWRRFNTRALTLGAGNDAKSGARDATSC